VNLIERIDRWGRVAPGAIAHVSGDRTLSYGELRQRSDALAAHLAERLGNDRAPIAILGHREPEMLVGFLGVVKTGRPYVPLDTALPQRRIDNILSIAGATLLLTPGEIDKLSARYSPAFNSCAEPDAAFYIIFTSGSTGQPKGVVITLRCLEHFIGSMLAEHSFAELRETFLNQAPFSFDLSVMDLYCSLATGGTLFSISRDLVASPKLLYRALTSSGVSTWVSTPSFAQMCLVERTFDDRMLPNTRRFLFCGETLPAETVGRLRKRFPKARIWNTYGPTEATVATTSIEIDDNILTKYSALPVGKPMPGTTVFVADEKRRPVKSGERGEIVIAGPNVSPGYLGAPDLTARAFFEHGGQRAYRTGDWGRWRDDLLFFEGRMDEQIKLSGYRIELGDVESNLRELSSVRDAVVLPTTKNGDVQSLVAFVVMSESEGTSDIAAANALREQLGQRLPVYMVPRKFVFLDAFPMTANGKADRSRLAESL
jgi:D-alanine--poly(phosphoribitol) ligase subunit 1